MQHCSQGAKCVQITAYGVTPNTPFEADELVTRLKIENRNIIYHKRLTPGNCCNSLPWQQARHVKINEICLSVYNFCFQDLPLASCCTRL